MADTVYRLQSRSVAEASTSSISPVLERLEPASIVHFDHLSKEVTESQDSRAVSEMPDTFAEYNENLRTTSQTRAKRAPWEYPRIQQEPGWTHQPSWGGSGVQPSQSTRVSHRNFEVTNCNNAQIANSIGPGPHKIWAKFDNVKLRGSDNFAAANISGQKAYTTDLTLIDGIIEKSHNFREANKEDHVPEGRPESYEEAGTRDPPATF